MPRLFTGLEIPNDVAFALSLKRGGLGKSRWINPSNYHITLRYIGEVDTHLANDIADGLNAIAIASPLNLTLNHLDVFGGDRPRALFAGMAKSDALEALQADHERLLQRYGLKPDGRKFTPHVTLARLSGVGGQEVAQHLECAGAFSPLSLRVEQFVLYSARESIGGGPYIVEERYPLVA